MCETVVKVSHNFELTHLKKTPKKKKERKRFGHLATFRFGTFTMFFMPLGVLLVMKTLEKAYKFTIFEILRDFFCIIVYCMFILSLHIGSTKCDMYTVSQRTVFCLITQ